ECDTESLLALYCQPRKAPDAKQALENLRVSIAEETLEELRDWRNQVGAHIDDKSPWDILEQGMREMRLDDCVMLLDHVELNLEITACTAGGPILLLLNDRHFKSLMPV